MKYTINTVISADSNCITDIMIRPPVAYIPNSEFENRLRATNIHINGHPFLSMNGNAIDKRSPARYGIINL